MTDNSGNSTSCNFTVTVTDDKKPIAKCKNTSIILDLNTGTSVITASDVDDGSYDNVAIASMSVNKTSFNCSDLGPNNVTLTVIDSSGNIGTCTSVVTVSYAVVPTPVVTPLTDVICNGESSGFILTNNIPVTTWTWTASSSPVISGASGDNTSSLSEIKQTLNNSDYIAQNTIYNITPKVYGLCNLAPISADIWINPVPKVNVSSTDTLVCNGESATISFLNPNVSVKGLWKCDVTVTADPEISGFRDSETYSGAADFTESLVNNDINMHKVVYRFTPRITPADGGPDCINGFEKTVTIWVFPKVKYTKDISLFNGFNISCYGKSTGSIKLLNPSGDAASLTYTWSGPDGFKASTKDITGLIAGQYNVSIIDKNMCTTNDTFNLTQPNRLSMTIKSSISIDGSYNINCAGDKTGSVSISAINNVGHAEYLWDDGNKEDSRTNLPAGTYKIIIRDANNCLTDSTVILIEPEKLNLSFDITKPFCPDKPDGEIRLSVTGGIRGNDYTYKWSDNSSGSNLTNILPGFYKVAVSDLNACSMKDSVRVVPESDFCLIIPEAISPNGDLINDLWNIGNIDLYPRIVITIYNRWGQEVWRSEPGYPFPWDGKSKGSVLPIDSYHYAIELNNGSRTYVGTITIVK